MVAVLAVFAAAAGWLAYTRAPAGGPARTLTVATTQPLAPLTEELAASFRRAHPDVVVLVDRFADAGGARAEMTSGRADVAVVDGGSGDRIGWRALALAADPQIGIRDISAGDLARVYRQQATLWSDLGAFAERPVTPVDRENGDPDHAAFDRLVLGDVAAPVANALVVPDDAAAAGALVRPGAIGYLGLRSLSGRPVSLDGVECSPATVRSGAWHLVEEIRAERAGASGSRYPSDFVSYARSGAGQAIVDRHEVAL